jgi:hypothetical protein
MQQRRAEVPLTLCVGGLLLLCWQGRDALFTPSTQVQPTQQLQQQDVQILEADNGHTKEASTIGSALHSEQKVHLHHLKRSGGPKAHRTAQQIQQKLMPLATEDKHPKHKLSRFQREHPNAFEKPPLSATIWKQQRKGAAYHKKLTGKAKDGAFPVDIVYTWVNGSDPRWLKQKRMTVHAGDHKQHNVSHDSNLPMRFVGHSELRYSMRSVSSFAPWARHIYVVVSAPEGSPQVPEWLNTSDPRVTLVPHSKIFAPYGKLPTFSSLAIECFIDRIEGLSEHFVYLNDDMFFGAPIKIGQFFTKSGAPRVAFQKWPMTFPHAEHWATETIGPLGDAYTFSTRNDDRLLDRYLGVPKGSIVRANPLHQAYPLTKSIMRRMRKTFPTAVQRTSSHRFRDKTDVLPHYLALWLALHQGNALALRSWEFPQNMFINLHEGTPGEVAMSKVSLNSVLSIRPKLFCLNDEMNVYTYDKELRTVLLKFFKTYFPKPANWELHDVQAKSEKALGTEVHTMLAQIQDLLDPECNEFCKKFSSEEDCRSANPDPEEDQSVVSTTVTEMGQKRGRPMGCHCSWAVTNATLGSAKCFDFYALPTKSSASAISPASISIGLVVLGTFQSIFLD